MVAVSYKNPKCIWKVTYMTIVVESVDSLLYKGNNNKKVFPNEVLVF